MNRSIKHRIAVTVLALGTLGAAMGAQAGDVRVSVGVQLPRATPVQVQPVPVHAPVYPVYDSGPRGYRPAPAPVRGMDRSCRAPRWEPRVRYMPGQVVKRGGHLFVARRVSASVWNVNSPPEQTPRYWARAQCR